MMNRLRLLHPLKTSACRLNLLIGQQIATTHIPSRSLGHHLHHHPRKSDRKEFPRTRANNHSNERRGH